MKRGFLIGLMVCIVTLFVGCSQEVNEKTLNIDLGNGSILETFSGTLEKGIPTGTGTAVISSNGVQWKFIGNFVDGMPSTGSAMEMPIVMHIHDNDYSGHYTGYLSNLKVDGSGTFSSDTITIDDQQATGVYEGTFSDGLPQTGTFTVTNGTDIILVYEYENGALLSTAVTDKEFTLEYEGEMLDGLYSGNVVDGLPDGSGTFTYTGGDDYFEYTGGWKHGATAATGYLKTNLYVVHFKEVDRTGEYDGETQDGVASGMGTFYAVNDYGEKYSYTGEWVSGLWEGKGSQIYEDGKDRIGTFFEGEFSPTFEEWIAYCGEFKPKYTLSESMMSRAKECYLMDYDSLVDATNFDLTYSVYIKSPDRYEGEVMLCTDYTVVQISEYDYQMTDENGNICNQPITEMILDYDYGDMVLYVYYLGSLDGLYEDDTVSVRGLPLAYSSYPNVADTTIKCIVMLAYVVSY